MISLPHFGEALQACLESLTQQSVADGDFCYAGPRLSRDSSVHGTYGGDWERESGLSEGVYIQMDIYVYLMYIMHMCIITKSVTWDKPLHITQNFMTAGVKL